MKRLWRQLIGPLAGSVLLLALSLLACTGSASAAAPIPQPDVSLKQLRVGDATAQGFVPTLRLWFPGYGDYALADGSYLYLEYDHSGLVRPDRSTLTVLLNGVPVSSVRLTAENSERTGWRISLPKDKLKRDTNLIELSYLMMLLDEECVTQENPALWSTIYEVSHIHYQYASPLRFLGLPDPDLGRFPEPFLRPTLPKGEVAFVLPDQPSSADLSVAASVAARFGQLSGGKPFNTRLHTAAQMDQQLRAQSDLVVVGRPETNSFLRALSPFLPLKAREDTAGAGFVDEAGAAIDPENGVLQEMRSPWDDRFTVLVVSGGADEGVRRASRTLTSRLGTKPLQGPYAIVTGAQEELRQGESQSQGNQPRRISLQQLGQSDWPARGAGKHSTTFSFDAPPLDGNTSASFELAITFSPLVDPDRSSIMVSVGGAPVRSLFLKPQGSERSTQRIPVSASSLHPGVNTMTVDFNLYTLPALGCGPEAAERAWAVLHANSELLFPVGSEQPSLDLANYPYPFVKDGTPSGSYLVLPEEGEMLADGLQVAVALGRQSLGPTTEMQAGLASQVTDEVKRRYDLIAYGLQENSSLVAEMSLRLPLSLEDSGRSLQRPELVLLGVKDVASLGILELVPSPWNPTRALLVASGTSSETSRRSLRALAGRFPAGNVALATVDDQGEDRLAGIKLAGATERLAQATVAQSQIYNLAAVVVILLVAGMMGLLFYQAVKPPQRGRP